MIDGRKKKICKEFGKNLKTVRTGKKMSVRELAAIAELEHAQIVRIEAGQINLTLATIHSLAEALGVAAAELVGGI